MIASVWYSVRSKFDRDEPISVHNVHHYNSGD